MGAKREWSVKWGKPVAKAVRRRRISQTIAVQSNCSENGECLQKVTSLGWTGSDISQLPVGLRCQ
jgi:hypothetical protein